MTTTAEWRKWNAVQTKPVTNYDLLIRKTPEELAGIMVSDCPPNYPKGECREYEKMMGIWIAPSAGSIG